MSTDPIPTAPPRQRWRERKKKEKETKELLHSFSGTATSPLLDSTFLSDSDRPIPSPLLDWNKLDRISCTPPTTPFFPPSSPAFPEWDYLEPSPPDASSWTATDEEQLTQLRRRGNVLVVLREYVVASFMLIFGLDRNWARGANARRLVVRGEGENARRLVARGEEPVDE
ncbi:hypothetical protein EJ06DRAFT_555194 [Trichodelitschia bisporula]|uniref:Uncharacterized protein n=1 Tax=Trichodelitschia bisporula TaxID=703511 RepID=A0A6G1I384_9PEZI|nr:hypothetical protein EJ06DRAFT_555194 [Trichodelitschia bisporula]